MARPVKPPANAWLAESFFALAICSASRFSRSSFCDVPGGDARGWGQRAVSRRSTGTVGDVGRSRSGRGALDNVGPGRRGLGAHRQGVCDAELLGAVAALLDDAQEVPPAEDGEDGAEGVLQRRGLVVGDPDAVVPVVRPGGGLVRGVGEHRPEEEDLGVDPRPVLGRRLGDGENLLAAPRRRRARRPPRARPRRGERRPDPGGRIDARARHARPGNHHHRATHAPHLAPRRAEPSHAHRAHEGCHRAACVRTTRACAVPPRRFETAIRYAQLCRRCCDF